MDYQTILNLISHYGINTMIVLATLSILIVIHEWGHFIAAKKSGVDVLEFSFGMGPKLWERLHRGTLYQIRLIPMGGFIRMAGDDMQHDNEQYQPNEFFGAKLRNRFLIVSAGPLMNLFLTCLIYFICFYVVSQHVTRPVIGYIEDDSAAKQSGMLSGDRVVSVNGTQLNTFESFTEIVSTNPGKPLLVEVSRDQSSHVLSVTPREVMVKNILGEPEPVGKLGVYSVNLPIVDTVMKDSPAAALGLQPGDRITHVSGNNVKYWEEVVAQIRNSPLKTLSISWVTTQGSSHTQDCVVESKKILDPDGNEKNIGYLGVSVAYNPEMSFEIKLGLMEAVQRTIKEIKTQIYFTVKGLLQIIGGDVSKDSVMGPVRIVDMVIGVAQTGFFPWLYFVGLISLQLFFFNLLPFPALDGGYILFFLFELVFGKPLPVKVLDYANRFGFITLITLLMFVVYNDFTQIF